MVDVKSEFTQILPLEVQEKAITVTHNMKDTNMYDSLARFTAAYQLMETYASAKLVITQRIHCALPCVAMGTPVIFINSPVMPGGGGTKTKSSSRTVGLTPLFHTVDLYGASMESARGWLKNFSWYNPPPNPNTSLMMRLRATAWNVIRQNQALYDAAHKFGLFPFSPPDPPSSDQLLFHLAFTTSNTTNIELIKHGGSMKGFLNWRHWRSVESIFFHHPHARVIIHSNNLLQSEFDVLTESGYNLEVLSYNLEELVKESPAWKFTEKLQEAKRGPFWYSHQTDLLRYLILFKWDGVYIDTDVIIDSCASS